MMRHHGARLLGVVGLLLTLPPSVASADPVKLVIVPVGDGPALIPTVAVAQALARRIKRPVIQLAYFAPELPEPADLKAKEKQASKLMKKAFASFDLMEYDKVKTTAGEALKIYKDLLKHHPGASPEGYLTCLHLMAASASLNGDTKEAFQTMSDAVIFDPRPPSKKVFNPAVQELYEQVRAEAPAQGTVVMQSATPAMVWFNGNLHGLAAGKASLKAGLYLARFYAPGFSPTQRWIRVQAHQEKPLKVTLESDPQPENENVARLRDEARAAEPGPAVSQASLDLGADEVILLAAAKTCVVGKCNVRLAWLKDGRWYRRRLAGYAGQPEVTAAALTGAKVAPTVPTVVGQPGVTPDTTRGCNMDNECPMDERCKSGRCVRPRSITRTWWFWTLVGAATVGVTLAIVLPLTRPSGPVIEVR
jgi:hypothetical protein